MPGDSAPLSNLSATHFEKGDYTLSFKYGQEALQLLENVDQSDPRKQRIWGRLARIQIHRQNWDGAAEFVEHLASEPERKALEGVIAVGKDVWVKYPGNPGKTMLRKELYTELPRYKARM